MDRLKNGVLVRLQHPAHHIFVSSNHFSFPSAIIVGGAICKINVNFAQSYSYCVWKTELRSARLQSDLCIRIIGCEGAHPGKAKLARAIAPVSGHFLALDDRECRINI